MMGKMKKPAPLLVILAILLITTLEMVPEVAAGGGNKLVCNAELLQCEGMCHKSEKCLRCCRHYGYIHGQCSLNQGHQGCYCCATVPVPGEQRMLKVIPASPPPAARHPPVHE